MPYNANIPLATDQISTSQADILGNFQTINAFVAVDHAALNAPDEGKHYFNVGVAPHVATATQVGIYAANGTFSESPELYINKAAPALQIAFTECSPAANGWTRLPSGIIIKWGSGTSQAAISWIEDGAQFAHVWSVALTPVTAGSLHYWFAYNTLSVNGFFPHAEDGNGHTAAGQSFTYIAIGN